MKTISIKGRPYITVAERIKEFRKEYKGYRIETKVIDVDPDWIIMKATVYDDDGKRIAVGHASERRERGVNQTSYVENCETSAVGRALGMMGIGIIDDIASGDEVALARDAEPDQIAQIEKLLETCSLDSDHKKRVEDEITELTYARAERCIAWLYENQLDPIDAGGNYSQKDIHKKLDKIV